MFDRFLAAAVFLATLVLAAAWLAHAFPRYTGSPPRPPASQAQVDASTLTPLGMVVNWARTETAGLAPGSVIWDALLANRDGSLVCLAYRTRGQERTEARRVAFVVGRQGAERQAWGEACEREVVLVANAEPWVAVR
jgi:hypothetical protein